MHAVIVLLRILIALRIVSEAEEIVKVPPRADRCIYIKRFPSRHKTEKFPDRQSLVYSCTRYGAGR